MFRARKLKNSLAILALVAVVLGLWAFWIEPAWLTTHKFVLQIPQWHAEHRGLKVAILTDLHVGSPHTGIEKLQQVVRRTNDERPDLVVLLGDFVIQGVVGDRFVEPEPIAKALQGLQAPLGVFAVLGNHDWWYDGPRVEKALAAAGVVVLENQAHSVQHRGKAFWVVGIADLWTRKPDLAGSLRQVYGQRYAMGHVVEEGRHLFVGGGVGSTILPVRFCVPPEVVLLELQ